MRSVRVCCQDLRAFSIFFYFSAVLSKSHAMGFGPVTSVVMFTDEPDVPIPEYLLPLYGWSIIIYIRTFQLTCEPVVVEVEVRCT